MSGVYWGIVSALVVMLALLIWSITFTSRVQDAPSVQNEEPTPHVKKDPSLKPAA